LITIGTFGTTGNVTAYLFADSAGAPSGSALGVGATNVVAQSTLPHSADSTTTNLTTAYTTAYATPTVFTWSTVFSGGTITPGNTYWVAVASDVSGATANCLGWGAQSSTYKPYTDDDGVAPWTLLGSNSNLNLKTYH